MHSTKPIQTAKTGYIVMSLLLCILGIVIIIHPEVSANTLCIMIGVLLICYGIFKVIGYLSKDLFRLAFQFDLAFGLLVVTVGIIMILRPTHMITLVNFVLGIIILSDGLFKVQIAIDSKKFGIRKWWLITILAVIAIAFGILLMIDPFTSTNLLMIMLGSALLAEGFLNFCVMLFTVKIIKNQYPEANNNQ
ncbi:hypothetical protein GCM10023142_16080 [Anaerocolumna aminovalerica]|uniref:Uncharacterized membrane protein HdeD, DUF308 family n=1 Tax=Anaerocolumna aminovalerica TaxID=1527 RepID=A0A1I5C2P5_9FIRM|nr:DUF308 domain-containing protein [Anaerocolumna aminovalerica]SFN81197.1 Uncharacterized membrane protein HdeD, DUF308 family [Anaerocolumna aminovalerica]